MLKFVWIFHIEPLTPISKISFFVNQNVFGDIFGASLELSLYYPHSIHLMSQQNLREAENL